MRPLKQFVRLLVPPILLLPFRRLRSQIAFRGNYASWSDALAAAQGYDADIILRTQLDAARKVRDGLAVYERDSVIFDEIEYSFPLLAALLYVASRNGGRLTVLDFGGALGSSYYQNRGMLSHLTRFRWCVVEQTHFVATGKAEFEDETLRFYATFDECLAAEKPDMVLLSSVLQYLPDPFGLLAEIAAQRFPFVVIDRTPVMDAGPERIVVQNVPARIYPASYACRLFRPGALECSLAGDYDLRYGFQAHIGTVIDLEDGRARYLGMFLARRDG